MSDLILDAHYLLSLNMVWVRLHLHTLLGTGHYFFFFEMRRFFDLGFPPVATGTGFETGALGRRRPALELSLGRGTAFALKSFLGREIDPDREPCEGRRVDLVLGRFRVGRGIIESTFHRSQLTLVHLMRDGLSCQGYLHRIEDDTNNSIHPPDYGAQNPP